MGRSDPIWLHARPRQRPCVPAAIMIDGRSSGRAGRRRIVIPEDIWLDFDEDPEQNSSSERGNFGAARRFCTEEPGSPADTPGHRNHVQNSTPFPALSNPVAPAAEPAILPRRWVFPRGRSMS